METLLKNLKTATFDSMERMFFLLADPEEEMNTTIASEVSVHIGVTGDPSYLVTIVIGKCLGARMASDLLGGSQDEITDDMIVKCLEETANVIAGRFLLLFDDAPGRDLTLPATGRDEVFPGRQVSRTGELVMSFEGCPMRMVLEAVA